MKLSLYERIVLFWHCKIKGAKKVYITSTATGERVTYTYDGKTAPYGVFVKCTTYLMENGNVHFNESSRRESHMKWKYI